MLIIVSAKNVEEAYKNIVDKGKRHTYIFEERGLQDFFFEYRDSFKSYEKYWELNPYGVSKVSNGNVFLIKEFTESVNEFVDEKISSNLELENRIIERFNLSISKIRKYVQSLIKLCDHAIKNNDDLYGIGD